MGLVDQLQQQVGGGGKSVAEIRSIVDSLGLSYEDRYVARPAAELLIEQGAPGAQTMAANIATMPITGKDRKGDVLRAAFKDALRRDGIPPDVEQTARDFYERRQRSSAPQPQPQYQQPQPAAQQYAPAQPAPAGQDVVSQIIQAISKLFRGQS